MVGESNEKDYFIDSISLYWGYCIDLWSYIVYSMVLKRSNMKHLLEILKTIISVAVVITLVFGAGFFFGRNYDKQEPKVVVDDSDSDFDLRLPGEQEKRVVTVDEVKLKLQEIKELATYSGTYEVTKSVDETRYVLDDIKLPGTKNTITVTCTGVVKVGYDLNDVSIKVETDKIYISLPEPQINDNYIVWDSIQFDEKNNILNPINSEQYTSLIKDIESEGLEKAINDGIYVDSEKNMKTIIDSFLGQFEGYSIEYM